MTTNITVWAKETALDLTHAAWQTTPLRNGFLIASTAHGFRKYRGPLTGMVVLATGIAATYKADSSPILSTLGALSFYFLPKAIEMTVQKTFSELAFWMLKKTGQGMFFVAVKGGTLVVRKVCPDKSDEQPISVEKVMQENEALRREVEKAEKFKKKILKDAEGPPASRTRAKTSHLK